MASSAGMWRHNSNAFLACHWLAMSSVCYNPFVYCWLNAAFRDAVKSCGRGLCWSAEPASFGRRRRPGGSGGGGGRHRPSLLNNTAARPGSAQLVFFLARTPLLTVVAILNQKRRRPTR